MQNGRQNVADNCPEKSIRDISYQDACSSAAYDLGTWGIAYLLHQTNQDALVDVFYPMLDQLGWDSAFESAFKRTPEQFYTEFELFLEKSWTEKAAVLATP